MVLRAHGLLSGLAALLFSCAVSAQQTYVTLIDADSNPATGCSVTTSSGTVTGIEQRLSVTVPATLPLQVAARTRETCAGSAFGAPVALPATPYPVGIDNGVSGSDVIEMGTTVASLGSSEGTLRLVFAASDGSGSDLVGAASPILFSFAGSTVAVPTLSEWGAFLLASLLVGWVVIRRRKLPRGVAGALVVCGFIGVVWAVPIALDGQVGDWNGVAPASTDATGDASPGNDIRAVFVTQDGANLYFRLDIVDVQAILPPNVAPSFAVGPNPVALEDAGARTLNNWATGISPGPASEAGQTVSFQVTGNTNPALFSVPPAVTPTGTLSFTPAPNANGAAVITLVLRDSGGTAYGGVDTSAPQNFTITVTAVNDAPGFTPGPNQVVAEDAGPQAVPGWATAISAGPADEAGQLVTFVVTGTSNPALFSAAPAISPTGTLTYTPATDQSGTATVTVVAQDNGGTANGGVDASAPQSFTITVTAVNDPPVNTVPGAQAVNALSTLVFSTGNGNRIGVADPDAGSAPVKVDVSVTAGTVAFAAGSSAAIIGNGSSSASATGTLAQVNAALDGLLYTPVAGVSQVVTLTVLSNDQGNTGAGGALTDTDTVSISVNSLNAPPVQTVPGPQSLLENATLVFNAANGNAISVADPDAGAGTLTTTVSVPGGQGIVTPNPGSGASITDSGTSSTQISGTLAQINAALDGLSYTRGPSASGTTVLTVVTNDNGNTGSGGAQSATSTIEITVTPVNDAPSFVKGGNQTVAEDAGPQSVAAWATAITAGPNESGQTVGFLVTGNTNPSLFSASPTVSPTGTLMYTPAANASGTATITLVLKDDGGTSNGGVDTSPPQTFVITVTAVNDAPGFTAASPPAVNEDAGAQTITGWATFSPGPADESAQTVVGYTVSAVSNPSLFSAAPAVATNGTLTYTPAPNASGSSTFSVTVQDSGGTAGGGVDTSAAQVFTITVNAINDAPSFVKGIDQTVAEDAGPQSVLGWATAISAGPNEAGQILSFVVTGNTNPGLFSAAPAVSSTGTLTYTPTANANGSATITLVLQDNGGTANGGVNTSPAQSFVITVTPVNDPPVVTPPPAYAAQANMQITVPDGASDLLAASVITDPDGAGGAPFTLTAGSVTSANATSPNVTLNANGSFTYNPPAGFVGADTFSFQVCDSGSPGNACSTATATVNVSGPVIWFLNPAAATNGNGTLASPFNSLASATAAMGTTSNQRIFVYSGTTTSGAGVTLPANGWLVGQGVTGTSFDAVMGIAPPATTIARPSIGGTAPIIQGSVNLNGNNVNVRGLRIQPPSGTPGLRATLAGPFTGLVVGDIPNVTTASARAVDLSNVSGTIAIQAVNASAADIGINLSNVNPSTGSFTVAGTGGTCTAGIPTCTGGTLSALTDSGIKLANARNVTLTRMRVSNTANFGLSGSSVANLTIDTSVFDGTHGDADNEGAIFVTNWSGTGAITSSQILGGASDNIRVENTTGTLNRLTISGSTIRNNTGLNARHGLHFAHGCGSAPTGCGGAVMNLTVSGASVFFNHVGNHVNAQANGLGTMDVVLSGNTFLTLDSVAFGGAVNTTFDHQADVTFDVSGNVSTGSKFSAFNFSGSSQAQSNASMIGWFRDNIVGTAGTANSASAQGSGLAVSTGGGTLTMSVTGNAIRNYGGSAGMAFNAGDAIASAGLVDITATRNTINIDTPLTVNQLHGLLASMGNTSTGNAITACLDIGGAGALANNVVGSSNPSQLGSELRVRQRNASNVRLPGFGGADAAGAINYLAGRNTVTAASFVTVTTQLPGALTGGAACLQP